MQVRRLFTSFALPLRNKANRIGERIQSVNDCSNCKYSLKQKGTAAKDAVHRFALNELKCKVFRTIFVSETPDSIQKEQPQTQSFTVPLQKEPYWNFYIDTKIAREDEKLCGKAGKYFKPKDYWE